MNFENLIDEKVKIEIESQENQTSMTISGEVDMENPAEILRPYLDSLHENFVRVGVKNVAVDFRNAQYMNSSGIKEFVRWILALNNTPEESKYLVKIIYSKDITWQCSSLPVLHRLQPDRTELDCI